MSFNSKLRRVVYGPNGGGANPIIGLPAGVTGTTWRGTGFEQGPPEPVELDEAALPWELREGNEPYLVAETSREGASLGPGMVSVATLLGLIAVGFILLAGM
jgi:hypothetical protein